MSVRWDNKRECYIVDYYPEGRAGKRVRLQLPRTVMDLGVARDIERHLRNPSENSEMRPHRRSTVKDLFPEYLKYCAMHRQESTYENVKWTYYRCIEKHLGSFMITEIDKGHTTVYKRLRLLDGVKNRTVNKEMSYFMGFLGWCRSEYDLPVKPFKYERLKEEKPARIVLSPMEAISLILNAELLYRVFFLALYALSLRFSECTGLKWDDLDESNRIIVVRGKGGKQRLLPVSEWLIYAFNAIRPETPEGERPSGLIFRSRITGGKIVNVTNAINRARRKAGITKHVHPHLLRHTLATHFLGWNINIKVVQEWLGHSREDTTANIYMHAELDHLRRAQEALDNHFEGQFSQKDFLPEKANPKQKRPYTMSEKALLARRAAAMKARMAKSLSIDKSGK